MTYTARSDEAIKELARDHVRGDKWGCYVTDPDVQMVFMPFLLVDSEQRREMFDSDICYLYANMKDAAPRSINGKPMFFSMFYLSTEDMRRLLKEIHRMETALDPDVDFDLEALLGHVDLVEGYVRRISKYWDHPEELQRLDEERRQDERARLRELHDKESRDEDEEKEYKSLRMVHYSVLVGDDDGNDE